MRRLTALALIATMAFPLWAEDAPARPERFLGLTPLETGAIVVGTIGVAFAYDREVREHLLNYSNSDPSEDLRKLGDKGQLAGPVLGAIFLTEGLAAHNDKSKETGILLLESFVAASAVTGAIKFAVGRKRPSDTGDPYTFRPGGHDSSFPSGHTTVAFAAATVLTEQYPSWWVGVPAYGLAATMGFSRMYANKHWLSDVLAGAAVGSTTSHLLRNHRRRNHGDSALIFNGEELTWLKRF